LTAAARRRRQTANPQRKQAPIAGTELELRDHVVKPSGQTKTDVKTRILDAADDIFVRRGIDGSSLH
jgi:AcrR family transcriptional regulator